MNNNIVNYNLQVELMNMFVVDHLHFSIFGTIASTVLTVAYRVQGTGKYPVFNKNRRFNDHESLKSYNLVHNVH